MFLQCKKSRWQIRKNILTAICLLASVASRLSVWQNLATLPFSFLRKGLKYYKPSIHRTKFILNNPLSFPRKQLISSPPPPSPPKKNTFNCVLNADSFKVGGKVQKQCLEHHWHCKLGDNITKIRF